METIRHLESATLPTPTKRYRGTVTFSNSAPVSTAPSNEKCPPSKDISAPRCAERQPACSRPPLTTSHQRTMQCLAAVVLLSLVQAVLSNPVFVDNPSLAQFQSGRNIRHLPCIVRKSGRSGVCMFAIDCIKQNGTHLGTCIDRFYFGSCCQLKDETALYAPEISDNSIDQNTISHFAHESTTLPTSALFKLTTESQSHAHSSSSVSETVKNVTQSYLHNKGDTTPHTTATATASGKPAQLPISKRPVAHTTHKTSQFVVRTTTTTTTTHKPTVAPTTIKPPRRRTTTAAPVLTTAHPKRPENEQRIDVTTPPTKFFTFQIVETTTPSPTEPSTKVDEVPTTHRPFFVPTRRHKPKPTSASDSFASEPAATNTTTSTTTHKPRPQTTRRQPTTKKPTQTKRPTTKPSRRPTPVATVTENTKLSNTTQIIRKPPITTTTSNDEILTTITELKTTQRPSAAAPQTTHAPRPKPKPTAQIVKVPKPSHDVVATTAAPAPTTTTTKTTKKPATATASAEENSSTSTVAKPSPTTTTASTTLRRTSTSTTTTTTPKPQTTSAPSTTTSTTTIAPKPSALTTEAPKVETQTIPHATPSMTTSKPGLITWTDVDGEPVTNATVVDDQWQPRPPPSDWIPVPTIEPATSNKTAALDTSGLTVITTESSRPATSTMISVATSVSEIMHNMSAVIPKPQRPAMHPVIATSPADTTAKPNKPKPTKIPTSSSSTTTSTTSTTTTTRRPTTETTIETEESSTTSNEFSTENIMGIGSTTEYSTEDYNATATTSTTTAPVNTLEGVDYRQICGRRMFPEPRIVGGSNAAFGRWPWQISLRQWRTSTYLHKCGAALLNENWAITAAHCVDNVPPSDLLLRLGEYDLAEEEEPYGYQERRVQIVASHPQFDPRTFEYDLALLRFYEPVAFQPNIIPVCVPDSDLDFIGQTAFVTGWGRLYEDGPLPSVLQEVAVPVINNTICESMYRAAGYIEHIPHIFICAGWKKGGYDSCEGDSGGPMVLQREEDKRFQLGGVISWGIGCAEVNQPGVYTRISEFRDWINQILQF